MGGAVETGEGPVGVYEADDEGDAALFPACVVDEGGEDEARVLVGWGYGGDGDEDDGEGDEGCPEGDFGDGGEGFAVAVEDEAEDVGHLVGDEYVPCFDDAGWVSRMYSIDH